jgi:AAHS family 4-hydroxybenzoate transporter-like MFS transporter
MPDAVLDVREFLDGRGIARTQWLILVLCFLVLVADGFHSSAIAFVAPAFAQELGISKLALGPVLSAALVGLGIGAFAAGPIADRMGRKRVLMAAVLVCSVGSLLSASARTAPTLLVYRLITGLGIGAAMPNCTTLAAEFLPARLRSMLSNLMFCGFPLGASMGGFLAAWLIPHAGWRSVFLLGGVAPLLLVMLLTRVPESIRFMVARGWPAKDIKAVLLRIAAGDEAATAQIDAASIFRAAEGPVSAARSPLAVILGPRYITGTLMLWVTYFMGLLLFYTLTSWMPTLVRDAGYSVSQASVATALFPLGGGVGALACGWLMDRRNSTRVVAGAYLLTALLMLVLSASTHGIGPMMCATFFAGVAMNGAQTSMPVLAASSYPTEARASGVSWMLGAGRMGGVAGAMLGGVLVQAGFSMAQIVAGLAGTALVAALALYGKDYASRAATALAASSPEQRL